MTDQDIIADLRAQLTAAKARELFAIMKTQEVAHRAFQETAPYKNKRGSQPRG